MAEREGFEPSVSVSQYTGLANRRLKPLGHLSPGRQSGLETGRKMEVSRAKVNGAKNPGKYNQYGNLPATGGDAQGVLQMPGGTSAAGETK